MLDQLVGKDVDPDTTGNGEAYRSANAAEEVEDGDGDGDFLVGNAGHDAELTAHGPDSGADAIEDLAHDEETDVGFGLAEVNEEGGSEGDEGDTAVGEPLEVTGVSDQPRESGISDLRFAV